MHILVCGAGAVGSIIAARLSHAGTHVSVLVKPEQEDILTQRGISLEDDGGIIVAKPKIISTLSGEDIFTHVLLCTKTQHIDAVLQTISAYKKAPTFCFQNGVRAEEIARSRGFTNTYGVVSFIGATLIATGRVQQHYEQDFVIGPKDKISEELGEILQEAGFGITYSDAIIAAKWGKLIFNLTNLFLAITGFSYQQILRDENAREIMALIMEEGKYAVEAAGIRIAPFGDKNVEKIIAKFRDQGNHVPPLDAKQSYSSTYQDLSLKRGETESDYLTKEIVDLGKRHGIATPINEYLLRRVEEMANNKEAPGHHVGKDMREICMLAKIAP